MHDEKTDEWAESDSFSASGRIPPKRKVDPIWILLLVLFLLFCLGLLLLVVRPTLLDGLFGNASGT
ncbi:MAG: hypothetical protein EOO16_11715 [Chitinophagaceae bacterium]|nr:MAG: hypothetical protein EOO16_11715 [Chitinophagaceae bacterium]